MRPALECHRAATLAGPSTRELEAALALLPGWRGGWRIVEREASAYRSTFPIDLIRLRDAGGAERRIVLKDLSTNGAGWRIRARFVRDPLREIVCYRDVLAPAGISAPAYWGSSVARDRGRYWLFLEHLDAEPLWQRGDARAWRHAAAWLAAMHARYAGRTGALPRRLIVHDGHHWTRWLDRARCMLLLGDNSPCSPAEVEGLIERARRAAAWLTRLPATLVHGDFHPSNVLVGPRADGAVIRPVDWEMAGLGPGVLDLAALTSGDWTEAEREVLIGAYRQGMPARLRPPALLLRRAVRRCQFLLAIRWLGWSPRWKPPPEHARDWLATALALAGDGDHGDNDRRLS